MSFLDIPFIKINLISLSPAARNCSKISEGIPSSYIVYTYYTLTAGEPFVILDKGNILFTSKRSLSPDPQRKVKVVQCNVQYGLSNVLGNKTYNTLGDAGDTGPATAIWAKQHWEA